MVGLEASRCLIGSSSVRGNVTPAMYLSFVGAVRILAGDDESSYRTRYVRRVS